MKSKRIGGIDIAKGITIMVVIASHYIQMCAPAYLNYFSSFDTALFFILSGYFLKLSMDRRTFIRKKAVGLLKPYLVVTVIWTGGMSVKELVKNDMMSALKQFAKCVYAIFWGGGQGKGSFYITPSFELKSISCEIGMLWFLLALFWGSLFVYEIIKINSGIIQLLAVIATVLIGLISSKILILPWCIQQGMYAMGYIYFGIYAKERNLYDRIKKNYKYITLCVIGIAFIFVMGKYSLFTMYCNYAQHGILDYAAAFLMSWGIIILCCYLDNSQFDLLKNVLSWLGRHTLYLLCIHFIDRNVCSFVLKKILDIMGVNALATSVITIIGSICLYCIVTMVITGCKNQSTLLLKKE